MKILNKLTKLKIFIYFLIDFMKSFLGLLSIFIIGLFMSALVKGDWNKFMRLFIVDTIIAVVESILIILNRFFKVSLTKTSLNQYQESYLKNSYLLNKDNTKNKPGDATSKILKTLPNIIECSIFELGDFYTSALALCLVVGVLYYYSWIIMAISIGLVLLLILLTFLISKKLAIKTEEQQKQINEGDGEFDVLISNFHKFFFYFKTKFLNFQLKSLNENINKSLNKININISLLNSIILFINFIFQTVLSTLVLFLYMKGSLPLSSIVSIPFLFGLMGQYLYNTSGSLTNYRSYIGIKREFFPLRKKDERKSIKEIQKLSFNNFNFERNQKNHYKADINLCFQKNKKYLILGQNGAGKSLLFKQLFSKEEKYTGDILIDDINKTEYKNQEIMKNILFIDSKMELLPVLIKENIVLGKTYSSEIISDVLKKLDLSKDILDKKPSEISQGEKQRIILASALILNPKWLIIDEGLSNLENKTFLKITDYLIKQKNLSLIHISHSKNNEGGAYDKVFNINEK